MGLIRGILKIAFSLLVVVVVVLIGSLTGLSATVLPLRGLGVLMMETFQHDSS